MSRRLPAWRAWVLASALLVACTPPTLPAEPRSELVIGIVGEPASLIDDPSAAAVAALLVEPLVRRTDAEDLEPRLVETVPTLENGGARISADGSIVADFRIREDALWHDGRPVGAEDVRFAFERDRRAPEGSAARAAAERIDAVEVLDDRTVRVLYRAGERWDLFALAPRALPRHLLGSDAALADYRARPVHAGPYRVASRGAGSLELVPFEDHPIDDPEIDRILVRTFADRTALLAAIGRGTIDVAPYPALQADLARTLDRSSGAASLQVLYKQAQAVTMLRLGQAFSEPAVRSAIALAVDRDRISRSVFSGRVRAPSSYLVPPLWAAVAGTAQDRDLDAARALLAGAGFRRSGFGGLERDGVPLAGTILVPRGSPALVD
ncbi:MAG: ABC transporter substrate-binding protein, partial [Candidatus Limnocylindria bacterium]